MKLQNGIHMGISSIDIILDPCHSMSIIDLGHSEDIQIISNFILVNFDLMTPHLISSIVVRARNHPHMPMAHELSLDSEQQYLEEQHNLW